MFKVIDRFGSFLKNWTLSKKVLAGIFIVGFVVSLIPIIITCFYSVPVYDDYNFGYYTHKSVMEGNSFFQGLIDTNIHFYMNWQGFYTYNFLAGMQLFNIDVSLYWISNLSTIVLITFSFFYFFKTILIDLVKCDFVDYLIITIAVYEFFIQFIPDISEAVYWMDGSLSMVTSSLFLVMISFMIQYIIIKNNKIYAFFSILLSIILSGATPILFITYLMISLFSVFYLFKNKNKRIILLFLVFVVMLVGLIVSVSAPGNNVRLSLGASMKGFPFLQSIVYAIFYSIIKMGDYCNLCFIMTLLLLSPIFWSMAKKTKFLFKNPLLVFIISYCIYAGRMSVQLYAGGYLGAGRQMNEYYLSFVLCMILSWFYFIGWLTRLDATKNIHIKYKRISIVFIVLICLFVASGCLNFGVKNLTSISTGYSLIKGETQQYSTEMKDRIVLYENDKIKDVVVTPLSVYPKFFKDEALKSDSKYWTNKSVAKYYNKKSVVLRDFE